MFSWCKVWLLRVMFGRVVVWLVWFGWFVMGVLQCWLGLRGGVACYVGMCWYMVCGVAE